MKAPIARHLDRLWQIHAPLTLFALLFAAATVLFATGIFLDDRVITGRPAWLKPTKFGISITIYSLTLTWMLGFIRGRRRLVGILGWTTIIMWLIELVIVLTKVVRGTTSHFNVATPLDSAMWSAMGIAIIVIWIVAILLLFQRVESPSFAWSLRIGLFLTLVGMVEGFLMTNPRPTARRHRGERTRNHCGGAGLPLVGWSTEGGDLRIAHFVGLHALQVMPFLGWLLSRSRRFSEPRRIGLVWTAGGSYLGFIALLTWQALRGQPLLMAPILFATLMMGPIGLLLYFAVRNVRTNIFSN